MSLKHLCESIEKRIEKDARRKEESVVVDPSQMEANILQAILNDIKRECPDWNAEEEGPLKVKALNDLFEYEYVRELSIEQHCHEILNIKKALAGIWKPEDKKMVSLKLTYQMIDLYLILERHFATHPSWIERRRMLFAQYGADDEDLRRRENELIEFIKNGDIAHDSDK